MRAAAESAEPFDGASTPEYRTRLFGWGAIAIAAAVAYANSFRVPFVFDGTNYLLENPAIREIPPLDRFFESHPLWTMAQTRPVTYLTFALNYRFGDYEPFGWHATNLAIHVVAAWALYGVARRALRSPKLGGRYADAAERLALVAAVVWVVHPLNTQSVTYLYQRLESLMGMFFLLTLYGTARYVESARFGWAAFAIVACWLGMGTKEAMITAPLVAVWYDRVFVADSWRELLRRRGLFYLLLGASWAWLAWLMNRTMPDYAKAGILDYGRVTPLEYGLSQAGVVLHYLRLVVWPWPLNIDYAWPITHDWRGAVPQLIGIGLVLAVALYAVLRRPAVGFLAGSVFLILAPTSSIAPIIDLCFEHRMYVPLAPAAASVVVAGYEAFGAIGRRRGWSSESVSTWRVAATWIVVAVLITLTLRRNFDYRSHTSLWGDVCGKSSNNPRANYNYGVFLQREATKPGDPVVDEAIAQYYLTLTLDPDYADAHLNLGNLYVWRGRDDEAEPHFQEYLRYRPDDAQTLHAMAELKHRKRQPESARSYLDRLLAVDPTHADGRKLKKVLEAEEER